MIPFGRSRNLVFAAWFSCVASAHALDTRAPSAEFEWRTPPESGCSTASQIEARIAGLTPRAFRRSVGGASQLPRIQAELLPNEGAWRAEIRVFDANGGPIGTRELAGKSPDCRSLDVSLTLVVATLLDALPEPVAAQSGEVPARAGERTRTEPFGVLAGLRAGIGLVPEAVFGVTLGVELSVPDAVVSVDGTAYLPSDDADARGRGARLWVWHAGLGFCPRIVRGSVPLHVCGGAQLGAIDASGLGLDSSAHHQRLVAIVGIEPRVGIRLGTSSGIELSALGGWVPIRPKFTVDLGGSELDSVRGTRFVLLVRIGIIGFLR